MKLTEILGFIESEIKEQLMSRTETTESLVEAGARERRRSQAGDKGKKKDRVKIGNLKRTGKKASDADKEAHGKTKSAGRHRAPTKGTVPTKRGRKMTPDQIAKREKIGDGIFASIKSNPKKKKPFIKAAQTHGVPEAEWPAFVWAAASNQALAPGSGLKKANAAKGKGKKAAPPSLGKAKKGSRPDWPEKNPLKSKKRGSKRDSKDKDQLDLGVK